VAAAGRLGECEVESAPGLQLMLVLLVTKGMTLRINNSSRDINGGGRPTGVMSVRLCRPEQIQSLSSDANAVPSRR
jgi:hypothetical protein